MKGIDIVTMRLEIGRGCVILGLRPHLFVEEYRYALESFRVLLGAFLDYIACEPRLHVHGLFGNKPY